LTRKLDTVLVSDLKGGEPFSSLPHAFRLGLVTRLVFYYRGCIFKIFVLSIGDHIY